MNSEQITKALETAKTNIISQIRHWNPHETLDETLFQNDQPQIQEFINQLSPLGFQKLSIGSLKNSNNIVANLYHTQRGIRVELHIHYSKKHNQKPVNYLTIRDTLALGGLGSNNSSSLTELIRTTSYRIYTRRFATYKLTTQHPTLADTIEQINKLGTYNKERPKFDLQQAWRTPSTTEYSYENNQIITNASIKTAKCYGICTINNKGHITQEGIQDPNQETYFHTDARDHQGRQIHFITNPDTDQYLIALRKGTNITIETAKTLFIEGGNPLDLETNITKTDIKIIQLAIQQWLRQ